MCGWVGECCECVGGWVECWECVGWVVVVYVWVDGCCVGEWLLCECVLLTMTYNMFYCSEISLSDR
jgi:hypothetical protein